MTRQPKKPRKSAAPKNKPFGRRFPERKSVAAVILAMNLRGLRKAQGFSQTGLAKALGVDQAAISLIERQRANPTLQMIQQIADALEVTVGELLTPPAKPK
ncbi:helix-turn-helix transcriptional regulator [Bradyrhizobium sp. WYCCWR 13022]|uniref:helix-turn-helix domain-containing protein n=1 Tax=unclassified Bradyrhizobium TaxID=2631580 RepID=UPI00263A8E9C|nr:helix-turn-helix transcriptional regulator [Bradyrhizobium sp. WYCCWR 13022]MDN4985561.1 helix-turn-helix transcriptional regulator [Bradyrhizobium sp. WYCCWR 13022]